MVGVGDMVCVSFTWSVSALYASGCVTDFSLHWLFGEAQISGRVQDTTGLPVNDH